MHTVTRRKLLAGVATAVLLLAPGCAEAKLLLRGIGTPSSVSTSNTTITFANTSGSASPSGAPVRIGKMFARGSVPSGSIAVPQVGGAPISYQCDNRTYWDDGSLRTAAYRMLMPVITGSGMSQVTFAVQAGSWNNTSANTVSDVTGSSDYKVAISNCHTAKVSAGGAAGVGQAQVALTIGGGGVTGGKVWFAPTLSMGATTLTGSISASGGGTVTVASSAGLANGSEILVGGNEVIHISGVAGNTLTYTTRGQCGTTAQAHSSGDSVQEVAIVSNGNGTTAAAIHTSGASVVVDIPGAGYSNVGAGSFGVGFNDGVTIVNASGNHVGASLEQYAKGPVCDAWRVRVPVPSLPHAYVTFYVERWKNSGGAFLAFLASAVIGNGMVDTANTLYNYTYDLDWKNGATVIRGTSLSTVGFTNLLHFAGCACGTFDTQAFEDWSTANDAAYKALVQQWTPTECDQIKAAGVIMPWLAEVPTVTVPTTPAYFEQGSNGGITYLCQYQPFGSAGIRSPMGSGGAGNQEGNMAETAALHWRALRTGTAGYLTWAQNNRVAAAHSFGTTQLGAAFVEPTTMYVPNTVPVTAQVFSGMTPTRQAAFGGDIPLAGFPNPVMEAVSTFAANGGAGTPYHQVNCTAYPAMVEGAQWMVDALMGASSNPIYCNTYGSHRQATLGGTIYYGIWANYINNVRIAAWPIRTQGYALALMPATWADGTTNIERSYLEYCTKNYFDYLNALVSFTGSVKFGTAGVVISKTIDFTGSGVWPESILPASSAGGELTIPFMDDYIMMVVAHMAFLFQGTSTGTSVAAWRDYFKLYYVALWAYPGSHYLNDSFRINALQGQPPALPTDLSWSSMGDVSQLKLAVHTGTIFGNSGSFISFASGVSTVTLSALIRFQGSTRIASGSAIKLTKTAINNGGAGTNPPAGFDDVTWYYWKELTSTTGQLCSDAALTTPVVPSSSASNVNFWTIPANALPADNSGLGTYNGGNVVGGASRIGVKLGVMRLCKALGMSDSPVSVTDAIANCATIFNALPGQIGYSTIGGVQYGWDSSR